MALQAETGQCSCSQTEGTEEYEWTECGACGFPCLLVVTHEWPHRVRVDHHEAWEEGPEFEACSEDGREWKIGQAKLY